MVGTSNQSVPVAWPLIISQTWMIFGVHPHGLKTFRYDGFQPWFQATYYKVVPPQVINGL